MADKEKIIEELLDNPLSYKDYEVIREILEWKRKLVFWDIEVTNIMKKLNAFEKAKQDMNTEEIKELKQKKIDNIDSEIDDLQDQIWDFEREKESYENLLNNI